MPRPPSISLAITTRGPAERVHNLLHIVRPHVDEIVLAVDGAGDQRCLELCAGLADQRLTFELRGSPARLIGWLRHQCAGDWILQLDDDEVPGAALLRALPDLVGDRRPSEISLPRRWLFPDRARYLSAHPWGLDYQARLIQNLPGTWAFEGTVHTMSEASGERRLVDLPFYHCDLVCSPPDMRLRKALVYERERPGLAIDAFPTNAMYLPEAIPSPSVEPVPAADRPLIDALLDPSPTERRRSPSPRPVRHASFAEIDVHNRNRPPEEQGFAAELSLGREIAPLLAGAQCHVLVRATNTGAEPWPRQPQAPAPVGLEYRWELDGLGLSGEAPLLESVWPGQRTQALMGVRAPLLPGTHGLRIELTRGRSTFASITVPVDVLPAPAPAPASEARSQEPGRVLERLQHRASFRPQPDGEWPPPASRPVPAATTAGRPGDSVTIAIETQTHGEGAAFDRVFAVVAAALEMAGRHGRTDVLVLDNGADPRVSERLAREFPTARRLDVAGLGYDEMKMLAARSVDSRTVAFLDGDCVPEEQGWLEHHLRRLDEGAPASGGRTRYEGGFRASVGTIMDFGFLLPAAPRELGRYASNNVAFRRKLLLEVPFPEGEMRCRCFAHAQSLLRSGRAVLMTPQAAVRHELPPFLWERFRQGFDTIASCWVDPALPEARWLRYGPLAAPRFFARAVALDWERLRVGYREVGLTRGQAIAAAPLFPLLRLIDLAGMMRGLARRRPPAR